MSKGPRNRLRGDELRKYEENKARIFRYDYYCNACDFKFKMEDAAWGLHGSGNHVTEHAKCPQCGTFELTENG